MRDIGFSTGAIAYGDFQKALDLLFDSKLKCIELSALRLSEVESLVRAIPTLKLDNYTYISFHAPSNFAADEESWLTQLLHASIPKDWTIVLHPDTISDFSLWRRFAGRIAIENMDRRKRRGRNTQELSDIFNQLPDALLCFDIGHACQIDPSMTEAFSILSVFGKKLVQVHLSEVNSESQHEKVSYGAKLAFQQIASLIQDRVPIILESRVSPAQIGQEIKNALEALSTVPPRKILLRMKSDDIGI